MSQLSGAQKTLCSVITQLAIIRVINPALSVTMLDEPSVFLDAQNMGRLLEMMTSIRENMSKTGAVMLIPTHDQDLVSACNQTITIGVKDGYD